MQDSNLLPHRRTKMSPKAFGNYEKKESKTIPETIKNSDSGAQEWVYSHTMHTRKTRQPLSILSRQTAHW